MIALLYARLSSDDRDGGTSGSVLRQLDESRERALAAGDVVESEFMDDGISGAQLHRPGIDALLAACRPGVRVWCKNQSRLGRDQDNIGHYRVLIREAGADLVCWAEAEASRMERGLRGIIDEQTVVRSREEAARILPARARAGLRNGGATPLGYRPAGDRWELDPEAVAPMVRAFELAAEGIALPEIAESIGMPVPSLAWRLKNPIYAGGAAWNRTRHVQSASGRMWGKPRPREEWIVVWDAAPAAVSRELWEAAQVAISSRAKRRGGRHLKGPLSGILVCGACGARLRVTTGFKAREGWVDCYGCRACRAIGAISTRGWIERLVAWIGTQLSDAWIDAAAERVVNAHQEGRTRGLAEAEAIAGSGVDPPGCERSTSNRWRQRSSSRAGTACCRRFRIQ